MKNPATAGYLEADALEQRERAESTAQLASPDRLVAALPHDVRGAELLPQGDPARGGCRAG
jgi:hypothetical protein